MFNSSPRYDAVMLVLGQSEDYGFVHVEVNGAVDHFNPKITFGDHQHVVWVSKNKKTKKIDNFN